jgi:predicted dehydrogenase
MKLRIALVGIGGYGASYVSELLKAGPEREVMIAGAIDPAPERCPMIDVLREDGVPVFADLEAFYQNEQADLVVISAPIQQHAPLTCMALAHGAHVLCEKPLAGSLADVERMIAARNASGKQVAIGFQWSFSQAILSIKRDILAGRFGKPLDGKALVLWPRGLSYYQRNRWAGRIRADDGSLVLDSPVNNATAHYLTTYSSCWATR